MSEDILELFIRGCNDRLTTLGRVPEALQATTQTEVDKIRHLLALQTTKGLRHLSLFSIKEHVALSQQRDHVVFDMLKMAKQMGCYR